MTSFRCATDKVICYVWCKQFIYLSFTYLLIICPCRVCEDDDIKVNYDLDWSMHMSAYQTFGVIYSHDIFNQCGFYKDNNNFTQAIKIVCREYITTWLL